MLPITYETAKSLLKYDPSITSQEAARILKLIKEGGESRLETKEPVRIWSRKEVAAILGKSVRYVDKLASDGHLTRLVLPGRTRACGFASTEIDKLIGGQV